VAKEYIIYCDESDTRGAYFSNFYGGVLVSSVDLLHAENILLNKKSELNLHKEVKWEKVTSNYCDKYVQLMDSFLKLVKENKLKVRVMFTQNIFIANNLTDYHREHEYFILYHQFVKHAFGLHFSNPHNEDFLKVRVYFDRLPINTKEKVEIFKSYIHGISNSPILRNAKVLIDKNQIAEIDSREHVILQCLDVVLGAMQFRLNNKHLEKVKETGRRGKRTLAKEKLYKYINQRICEIYPNFNIGKTTGKGGDLSNLWHHPYRHWLFAPKDSQLDLSKGKKLKKSG
jgi:uncharacterized protein DUF3800